MGGKPVAKCAGCGVQTSPRARYVSTLGQRLGKRYFCPDCAAQAQEADRLARPLRKGGRAKQAPVTAVCQSVESPNGRHKWQLVVGYDRGVYGSWGTCDWCQARRHYPAPQMGGWDSRQIFREHVA